MNGPSPVAGIVAFTDSLEAPDPSSLKRAAAVALELNLPLLPNEVATQNRESDTPQIVVAVSSTRIELRVIAGEDGLRGGHPVLVDWSKIDVTSPFGRSLKQPLARAIARKRYADPAPSVLDATAGLGEDSWVLAALGCQVTSIERHPIIATLLRDGLERARSHLPEVAGRITIRQESAADVLHELLQKPPQQRPDIVFLDPMFPTGRKTREQKSMRVLRLIVGDDTDAPDLLALARQVAQNRVIVKRPIHAPGLGPRPSVVHEGKSLRFDVFAAVDV